MPIALLFTLTVGGLSGLLLWSLFRQLPTHWLLEYGESEIPPELRAIQQAPWWPDAILLMLAGGTLASLAWFRLPHGLDLIIFGISAALLLLILVADWKTLIIPDPLTFGLMALAGLNAGWLLTSGDISLGGLLGRFLAGLFAAALFLLIGWIGEKMAGQEALGMGDVKLIAACVWLVGYEKAASLIFLSFVSASVIALPMLVRKYTAKGPDRPADALPFGPFIALATILVQVLEPELTGLWSLYMRQFQ